MNGAGPPLGGRVKGTGPPLGGRVEGTGPPLGGRVEGTGPPLGGRVEGAAPPLGGRVEGTGPPPGGRVTVEWAGSASTNWKCDVVGMTAGVEATKKEEVSKEGAAGLLVESTGIITTSC